MTWAGKGTSNENRRVDASCDDMWNAESSHIRMLCSNWLTMTVSAPEAASIIHTVPAASYWPVRAKLAFKFPWFITSRKELKGELCALLLIAHGGMSITLLGTAFPPSALCLMRYGINSRSTKIFFSSAHAFKHKDPASRDCSPIKSTKGTYLSAFAPEAAPCISPEAVAGCAPEAATRFESAA